jgi:hypothetical protein
MVAIDEQRCGNRQQPIISTVVIPNQEMATPFLDLKTNTGFGFQLTKV